MNAKDSSDSSMLTSLQRANQAFIKLRSINSIERNRVVQQIAQQLEESFDEILEANTLDLETNREMAVPEIIVNWIKLTPERLESAVKILERLSRLSYPTQHIINALYQSDMSETYTQLMPLGVVAFIYEALPELAAIAAGFCIKTGNCIILKGCGSATYSNAAIFKVLQNTIAGTKLPTECIQFISSEQGITNQELVTQDQYINLVIPYGRSSLVKQVVEQATTPVLRSAIGNCYLYWSASQDLELVRSIIVDSHSSEPDPVNAIEKVLVDDTIKPSSLVRLFNLLKENSFTLKGEINIFQQFPEHLSIAKTIDWHTAYLNKTVAFKFVNNLAEAVDWINLYSSGHANCIVTESYQESQYFAQKLDSALIYINSSPKFERSPLKGESIFLGMSNQKGYRRGLIGLETFTTIKQVVQGNNYL
jgi:glutamate-5-semialdehyde dehydrogenase